MIRPLASISRAIRVWRWNRAASRTKRDPLREFIYLNNSSVVSLLASRLGPIADQITDSVTTTRSSEFGGSIGQPSIPTPTSLSVKASAGQSQSVSTVKRATAQSNFRMLAKFENSRIYRVTGKEFEQNSELSSALRVKPEFIRYFKRGQLLEVQIHLAADQSFNTNLVVTELAQMIGNDAEEFGMAPSDLRKVVALQRIIGRMQVGLVPIRSNLAEPAPEGLVLVATTNTENYWQDLRQALFSGELFTAMVRLTTDGLTSEWNPNKLLEVLAPIAPELASSIESLPYLSLDGSSSDDGGEVALRQAVAAYVRRSLEAGGVDPEQSPYMPDEILSSPNVGDTQRYAFRAADRFLGLAGVTLDREKAADIRDDSLRNSGLLPDRQSSSDVALSLSTQRPADVPAPTFICAEVVAIYW